MLESTKENQDVVGQIRSEVDAAKSSAQQLGFLLSSVKSAQVRIARNFEKWKEELEEVKRLYNHVHDEHIHPCCHDYFEFGKTEKGKKSEEEVLFTPSTHGCPRLWQSNNLDYSLTCAETLARETWTSSDMDGNGYVFCRDFIFYPDDRKVPFMVRSLQKSHQYSLKLPMISWEEYKATVTPSVIWWERFLD